MRAMSSRVTTGRQMEDREFVRALLRVGVLVLDALLVVYRLLPV